MVNHPHRSKKRRQVDFADVPMRSPEATEPTWSPNIQDFDNADRDKEGLRRIGSWVLIPDYQIIAKVGSAEHQDWQARDAADAAYGEVVYHGSGDVREGYEAARAVLRRHLSETGRRVRWCIGPRQYLEP